LKRSIWRIQKKEGASFKKFIKQQIEKRNYNLDIFWILYEETEMELFDPLSIATELAQNIESALQSIKIIKDKLESE
jgi:predicted CopG family antitoxin